MNQGASIRAVCEDNKLVQHEATFAKALHSLGPIGPKHACAVAQEYHSLGNLMQHILSQPEAAACNPIARLKLAGAIADMLCMSQPESVACHPMARLKVAGAIAGRLCMSRHE